MKQVSQYYQDGRISPERAPEPFCKSGGVNVQTISGDLEKYRSDRNLILILSFGDGCLAAIMHPAKGPKAFSRKWVEVLWEDATVVIKDCHRAQVLQGHRRRTCGKLSQGLQCHREPEALSQAARDEAQSRRIFLDYLASSRTTLKAAENLRTGRPMMMGS